MKRDQEASAPLSVMQQRIWFMEAMLEGHCTYNLCSARKLTGPLNVAALERAINALIERHGALRTMIRGTDSQATEQIVLTHRAFHLPPAEDLSLLSEPDRQLRLDSRLADIAREPISLHGGPLFECMLFRLAHDEHLLLFKIHHIVFDGWSMGVVLRDLGQLYALHCAGAPAELPPLPISYAEFAAWHNAWLSSEALQQHVRYWTERLKSLGEPLALPSDHPRPRHPSNDAGSVTFAIDRATTGRLRELAHAQEASVFGAALAAYFVFLHKTSGQTDLVVGMPVHGRRDFAECHDLVGMFANTIAVRFEVRPGESFRDMLRRIGQTLRDDLSHSHAPLEQVVRELQIPRDLSRSPVYQAFFGFQDIRDRTSQWDGLHLQPYTVPITAIAEDINCMMTERADGLAGLLSYSVDLFSPASARAFAERYQQLLERLSAEPDAPIKTANMNSAAELRRMQSWNDTTSPYDRHASVHGLIAARAALRRADPALHMGHDSVSHGELDARANRLAQLLRSRGIGRGALVGLCVERSVAMVVAQLAVLKAGAAYVPLDPAYPANRLAYMAEDAQLALLISESALQDRLEWPRERSLLLDIDAPAIARQPDAALAPDAALDARPDDPAYVIYTSGSTGKPKGVIVQHRAAVNFLASMARAPGLTAADRLVAVTTLSFDIAVLELLLPLTVGAQVFLASRDETTDGQALRTLLESSRATVMQATPATWRMLIDAGWQGTRGFKALIGGEGLPSDLAHQLLERVAELWNMYGPTETTVWSTCWKVEQIDSGISIGQPIANTQVHILDERGDPCPIGVPGEIYIGGDGVTLGYLNRPELTAERFVPDPFSSVPAARLYRTGDRGRWRHDGLLEHMGRLDFQVKVRGHRIELGEIESNLATHPQVARTVVIVREDRPGDVRLVAYVVAREAMPTAAELREHLRANQPEYSLPQHFVPLEAIPLLPNGKINRHALPAPADDAAGDDTPYDAPRNDAEAAMAEIWQQLLGIARVSVTANFFDLGGHSMLAMRLVAQVHKRFGKKLPLAALLERGTIRQLVASLNHNDAARNSLVLIRPGGTRPPVFLVHDGIGETLLYRSLAYCLDAGHAVYGLQPRSEDGYAMLHSRISEMAAYHVEKIRSVQPHGPYLLGGLCAGGVIAFEIARQLQARGETIAMVALLDAADAAAERRRGQITGKRLRGFVGAFKHDEALPPLQRMARSSARAARKVWNLLSYEAGSLFGRLITAAKLRLLRHRLDRQMPLPAFLRSLSVPQIYQYALFDAATRDVLDGDVALFRATQGSGAADDEPYIDVFSDPLFGWATHVHGRVHTFDVPGGHTSMLQEPNVHVLAERMQGYIDMSLAHAVRAMPKETAAAERAITEEITECAESPAS